MTKYEQRTAFYNAIYRPIEKRFEETPGALCDDAPPAACNCAECPARHICQLTAIMETVMNRILTE